MTTSETMTAQTFDHSAHLSRRPFATLTWWSLLCLLSMPALAGPSQPHFGSSPQGQFSRAPSEPAALPSAAESAAERSAVCPSDQRLYRKSLLITTFARRGAASQNAESLWSIGQNLPALMGQSLSEHNSLFHYQLSQGSLPANATAQQVRELARGADTQLVLSGELLDLAMARPAEALNPNLINRARNATVSTLRLNPAWDSRQRDFALRLTLFNGITGTPVAYRDYRLRGAWNPSRPANTQFGTPGFWESDYGQKIRGIVATAGEEMGETIRCQPLIARLKPHRMGAHQVLEAGFQQGLAPGDRLPLQQLTYRELPGRYREYRAHMLDSGVRLIVEEVHPAYSLVRLEGDVTLHGEHLAVTPGQEHSATAEYSWHREY